MNSIEICYLLVTYLRVNSDSLAFDIQGMASEEIPSLIWLLDPG